MEMSCLWTRHLLLGTNSVLRVKHHPPSASSFTATLSIQTPPLISLSFPASPPHVHLYSILTIAPTSAIEGANIKAFRFSGNQGAKAQHKATVQTLNKQINAENDLECLEHLNKDFVKMLGHHAKFKALSLENILTASDGTRKVSIN
ncbi:hypothetical protein POTOM_032223 [Populus tomentosa]|uniref:Uncharacterized protein n=1 Tax=Populus tomentosa TaxID=118781 RepID=A0A8X8CSB2_POPTO|nr:hypothetical protein POTOM_032223 [Populus tomentosa]